MFPAVAVLAACIAPAFYHLWAAMQVDKFMNIFISQIMAAKNNKWLK